MFRFIVCGSCNIIIYAEMKILGDVLIMKLYDVILANQFYNLI
jgi:hypothetical protein